MLHSSSEIEALKALVVLDHPHHVDIKIARWLRDNRSMKDAAKYLRQFGWSLDSARCILLHDAGAIAQKA